MIQNTVILVKVCSKKVISLLIKFQTWPLSAVRVYILLIINFIN